MYVRAWLRAPLLSAREQPHGTNTDKAVPSVSQDAPGIQPLPHPQAGSCLRGFPHTLMVLWPYCPPTNPGPHGPTCTCAAEVVPSTDPRVLQRWCLARTHMHVCCRGGS